MAAISQGPMYPSLFKRSSTSPRKSGGASGGAAHLRSLPPLGGAAEVIANARSHLDRARMHLNLPPLPQVEFAPARVAAAAAAQSYVATDAYVANGAPPSVDADAARRRSTLQCELDKAVRGLASVAGDNLDSYMRVPASAHGGDETAAYMAQLLGFLQSDALRHPPPAAAPALAAPDTSVADLALAQAQNALKEESQKVGVAQQKLAEQADANAAALASSAQALEDETARKVAVEAELTEARGALAAGSDAGAMLAAEQAESQASKQEAVEVGVRVTELEAALEAEKAKVGALEASAAAAADEQQHADDVLISWLSMEEGRELLEEMCALGAHQALVDKDCDGDEDQARMMDAARDAARDEDVIAGTGMLHTVVKAVCDVALACQETKSTGQSQAQGLTASHEAESLRTELADAVQRETEYQAKQESDGTEIAKLREQIAAAEANAKALSEEAVAAQAKAAVMEAVSVQPVAGGGDDEYLDTITNSEARAWWRTYIGAREATYNKVQDAATAWMLKVDSTMTQAEASIVAATVCFGIDRDGDGEITYAEFGTFAADLGDEYTVAKLREFEVGRKEEHMDDETKLHEYAEYLGIDAVVEENILWIAKKCMNAPLPKGWKEFTDDQGQSYFHHETKNETSWDHPLDSHFKQLVKDTRDRMAESAGGAGTPPPREAADGNESVDAPTVE